MTAKTALRVASMAAMIAVVVSLGSTVAVAQNYLLGYFSNNRTGAPDATVWIANDGQNFASVCAMVYAFGPDEVMEACCGCVVSVLGVRKISVKNNLFLSIVGPKPLYGQVKVIPATVNGVPCDPTANVTPIAGLGAWSTHIQDLAERRYPVTESPLTVSPLGATLLANLEAQCGAVQTNHCTCG